MSKILTVYPQNQCEIGVRLFYERSNGNSIDSNVALACLKIASSSQRCLQHLFFLTLTCLNLHFSADLDRLCSPFLSFWGKRRTTNCGCNLDLCVNECVFTGSTTAQLRVNKNKTESLFLFCVTGFFVLAETSWDHLNDGHHTSLVYLS